VQQPADGDPCNVDERWRKAHARVGPRARRFAGPPRRAGPAEQRSPAGRPVAATFNSPAWSSDRGGGARIRARGLRIVLATRIQTGRVPSGPAYAEETLRQYGGSEKGLAAWVAQSARPSTPLADQRLTATREPARCARRGQ
jgi:hypothetical protein